MKQADFVRKSRLARSTVSDWYRGSRVPDPSSCMVIAQYLPAGRLEVLEAAGHVVLPDELPLDDLRRTPRDLLLELDPAKPGFQMDDAALDYYRKLFPTLDNDML